MSKLALKFQFFYKNLYYYYSVLILWWYKAWKWVFINILICSTDKALFRVGSLMILNFRKG